MGAHVEFRIVCTGNGKHRRVLLTLAPEPPRGPHGSWAGSQSDLLALDWSYWIVIGSYSKGKRVVYDSGAAERTGDEWRFWCKSCHRVQTIDDAELGRAVLDKVRSGVSEADMAGLAG